MNRAEFSRYLEVFLKKHPEYGKEVLQLAKAVNSSNESTVSAAVLYEFGKKHRKMYESLLDCIKDQGGELGRMFCIYDPFPREILQRLNLAKTNDHYRNWADTVKAVPKYTMPLPKVDGGYIRNAREVWSQNICGNEEVRDVILRHIVEYGKTGKTVPILLVGPPGIGKTSVAKSYGEMMGLPCSFVSGPSASANRGLAGAPNLYTGAGAGAVVQSMIDSGIGNPVIMIDELEKAAGGYSGMPDFQNELLAALDESNVRWHDNFLEMDLDASHIPYIFTANDNGSIAPPLLDRMEVVEMRAPTKDMLYSITKDYTLPRVLKTYDCEQIRLEDEKLEELIELLWSEGNRSCRAYQKAVQLLISTAYMSVIEYEKPVHISTDDVKRAVGRCSKTKTKTMGF